jgi:hypothetical protein
MADKLDNQQQQSYDEEQDFHNARKQGNVICYNIDIVNECFDKFSVLIN